MCAEGAEPSVRPERRAYAQDGVALRVGVDEHRVVLKRLEAVTARADEPAAMPAGDDRADGRQGAAGVVGQIPTEGDEPGRGSDSPATAGALWNYDRTRTPELRKRPIVAGGTGGSCKRRT